MPKIDPRACCQFCGAEGSVKAIDHGRWYCCVECDRHFYADKVTFLPDCNEDGEPLEEENENGHDNSSR